MYNWLLENKERIKIKIRRAESWVEPWMVNRTEARKHKKGMLEKEAREGARTGNPRGKQSET